MFIQNGSLAVAGLVLSNRYRFPALLLPATASKCAATSRWLPTPTIEAPNFWDVGPDTGCGLISFLFNAPVAALKTYTAPSEPEGSWRSRLLIKISGPFEPSAPP